MSDIVDVINNTQNFQFEIKIDNELAYMVYRVREDSIYFMHTKVPKQFEGMGIASKLASYAIKYAKTNNLKITPYCPFMRSYLEKHPLS